MTSLLSLPDEVKIKIYLYLDGPSKVDLAKACTDLQRIGLDREVLHKLTFCNTYLTNLSHLQFIGRKPNCYYVTHLNITGIHWITSAKLRNVLKNFLNLRSLYVTDTQLSCRDLTVVLKSATKVTKLAISLKPDQSADVMKIKIDLPITHLYVTYNTFSTRSFLSLLSHFETLEELWVKEPYVPVRNVCMSAENNRVGNGRKLPKITKKFVATRSDINLLFINSLVENLHLQDFVQLKNENFFVVYENLKDCQFIEIQQNKNSFEDHFHTILQAIPQFAFLDVRDIRKMILAKSSFSETYYSSLNFSGLEYAMSSIENIGQIDTLKLAMEEVLLSKLTEKIKRLITLTLAFSDKKDDKEMHNLHSTIKFKKPRIGTSSVATDENCFFARYTKHAKNIEEFAIYNKEIYMMGRTWHSDTLKYIKNWTMLKKLTITADLVNGKFFIEITKNCPLLQTLKIKDESVQDRFSTDFCESLRFANNLKDFRLEKRGTIQIDKIFEALANCTNLERLYIECRFAGKISKKPLETLLKTCGKLIFLFILVSELAESVCKQIKQNINEFWTRPQQIFKIRGKSYSPANIMYEDIPLCHIQEIICQETEFSSEYMSTF